MGGLEFGGLSKRTVLLAAGVLVVLLATLIALYALVLRNPYRVLLSDLRTADAATIVAELDKKKVPYRLADGGATILVPRNVADATRLSVTSEDLPIKGTVGFELFNKSDMGLTEFAQQINYRRALQGELARTIMALQGVESARVHLSLAEPAVFREDRRPSKASVTVIARRGESLPAATVRGIQSLVAAAVPDLEPMSVVILDERGQVLGGSQASVTLASPSETRDPEETYAEAIRSAISQFHPDLRVHVLVRAGPDADEPSDLHARQFPLHVKILAEGQLSAEMRSKLQQLAIAAAGLDPAFGDVLALVPLGEAKQSAEPLTQPTTPSFAGAEAHPASSPSASILLTLGVVLSGLLAAAWLLHRRMRPKSLSAAQKRALAARLQLLLVQEAAHDLR